MSPSVTVRQSDVFSIVGQHWRKNMENHQCKPLNIEAIWCFTTPNLKLFFKGEKISKASGMEIKKSTWVLQWLLLSYCFQPRATGL